MKIVADENMPLVERLFAPFGEVVLLPGRSIAKRHIQDAKVLLVRSVSEVNAALLAGSAVRFVGSATIGTDHIDRHYLAKQQIEFAYAPGCNAQAVAEYVLTAIAYWAEQRQRDLQRIRVGIIGAGNVGSRLAAILDRLGIEYRLNDPPRAEKGDSRELVALEELLDCEVISCHVPLTREGPYPTHHLIDRDFIDSLPDGALLINSARGAVVDNQAALAVKQAGKVIDYVFDVWEGEPVVNPLLLEQCLLATPHIAGYSQEGKIRGTYQLYQAFCQWQGKMPQVALQDLLPQAPKWQPAASLERLYQELKDFYDIRADDQRMRQVKATIGQEFDNLRKNYPQRLEFLESV